MQTRFCMLGTNLHAQSVLVSKISASELSQKFIKSALLVGGGSLIETPRCCLHQPSTPPLPIPTQPGQQVDGCFELEECTLSPVVETYSAAGVQDCLDQCKSHPECEFSTFYEDSDVSCWEFLACEQEDRVPCVDCYTSERTCDGN